MMPRHQRQHHGRLDGVDVGVADPAGIDLDAHVTRADLAALDGGGRESRARLGGGVGTCLHDAPSGRRGGELQKRSRRVVFTRAQDAGAERRLVGRVGHALRLQ